MSESPRSEGKPPSEGEAKGDREEPAPSDEDDDYEGYFLEPAGNNVDIAERVAEANKKLLEEEDEGGDRPRKVQFSEELINFVPDYYSDEESPRNSLVSEEDPEIKFAQEPPPANEDEEIAEEIVKEPLELEEGNGKLLLVLLPKEQNSSCESIIGEEIPGQKPPEREEKEETEKSVKMKIARPKSAKKSCEMSKISPSLSYSSNLERKSWHPSAKTRGKADGGERRTTAEETRVEIKKRAVKKINIGELELQEAALRRCCDNRPKSSCDAKRNPPGGHRPKTAPMKRTCCVIRTELPRYNGLRSEYGLSAEQLQERKQKTMELKQQKTQEKLREKQEESRRRRENEEMFRKWLSNKTRKSLGKKTNKLTDTLARSDVYIQTHAVYAANRNVPYSVDYSLSKKVGHKKRESWEKKSKIIILDRLFDKASPHFKRSFNIYLGVRLQ